MIVTPVSGSPAMSARSTGAAPRQRGRSDGCDVEPEPLVEQRLGDDEAVRDRDDDRGTEIEARLEPLGLEHGDPEAFRGLLGRRRHELATSARRRIRPREDRT